MGRLRHQPSDAGFSRFTFKTLIPPSTSHNRGIKAGGGGTPALRFDRTLPLCCSGIGGSRWRRRKTEGVDPRVGAEEAEAGRAMGAREAARACCQEEEVPLDPENNLRPCPEVGQGGPRLNSSNELVQLKREARTKGPSSCSSSGSGCTASHLLSSFNNTRLGHPLLDFQHLLTPWMLPVLALQYQCNATKNSSSMACF